MSVLSDNYKRIVLEIEKKISNPEELEFVKQKVSELSMMFMDVIDSISNMTDTKIKDMEERQDRLANKLDAVQKSIDVIENDIYENDEEIFDFEIVCPYCNNEFVAELNDKETMKNEIICPECNNIIELDWNDEEDSGCSGHCGGCHGCGDDEIEDEEENDDDM